MSYSFSDKEETKSKLLDLTSDYVYCPKCGIKNILEKRHSGSIINHYCSNCKARLNDYWESYKAERITLFKCLSCDELTFEPYNYCISCGFKLKEIKVMKSSSKSREIIIPSKYRKPQIFKDPLSDDEIDKWIRMKLRFKGREKIFRLLILGLVLAPTLSLAGIGLGMWGLLESFENSQLGTFLLIAGFALALIGLISLIFIVTYLRRGPNNPNNEETN